MEDDSPVIYGLELNVSLRCVNLNIVFMGRKWKNPGWTRGICNNQCQFKFVSTVNVLNGRNKVYYLRLVTPN